MKILIVSSGDLFSTYGGGQVYVKHLVDELINRGLSVAIAVSGEPNSAVSVYRGASLYYYPDLTEDNKRDVLISLLRKISPDIAHVHGDKAAFAWACNASGIPCIITAHHGGILCPAGTLLNHRDKICRVRANYRDCLPCVLKTIRGGIASWYLLSLLPRQALLFAGRKLRDRGFIPYLTPVASTPLHIQEKYDEWSTIIRYAGLLIAPSHAMAESMILNGAAEKMVRIVPHGITLPSVPILNRQVLQRSQSTVKMRFFYVGRICYYKGLHVLLDAFSGIDGLAELHIIGGIGNKAEQRYLQKLKSRYGNNPRIVWHGKIDNTMISALIAEFDVMVHSTICLEVFGLNIAEALAMGKPVIATRCGGAEMQIRDGVNGFLVTPNDVEALAGAMRKFVNEDVDLRRLSQAAPVSVVSLEEHVSLLCDLYHQSAL